MALFYGKHHNIASDFNRWVELSISLLIHIRNYPVGGELSGGRGIIRGNDFPGDFSRGGFFAGGNFPRGGEFPGRNFPEGERLYPIQYTDTVDNINLTQPINM